MKDQKKAEAIAAQRMQLLSPLLAEGLDAGKARQMKEQLCRETGLSDRTIRRYLERYRQDGFGGLRPKGRPPTKSLPAIGAEILEQAILLRREVPSRSVAQIIQVLEWEGKVPRGHLKRSSLQEKLAESGYSTRQMRLYAATGVAARRFVHRHRNRLWHSDVKFGPYLPIGPNGAKKQVYLVTFIDDATRLVLHGEFYPTLDAVIVEDCFRKAIHKFGVPETVYFDNGKQYRTKWMTRACSKLGIRLLFAKPYSPESTGKVERFNRMVDAFLKEAALEKPKTLQRLNTLFTVWLEECYQHKPHGALANQTSPEAAFRGDHKALRFPTPEVLADAFLHYEQRKVDKTGCISFGGQPYEVGLAFIGRTVDIIYDPADTTELTIEYEGHSPFKVKRLKIGERAGQRPGLPQRLTKQPADSSRVLTAAASQNEQRRQRQTVLAVSYRTAAREDKRDV